jgi:hypothetical protein
MQCHGLMNAIVACDGEKSMRRRVHHEKGFLFSECNSVNTGVNNTSHEVIMIMVTIRIKPVLILQSGFALFHTLRDDKQSTNNQQTFCQTCSESSPDRRAVSAFTAA